MCTEAEPLEDILFHRGRRMRPKANKSADPLGPAGGEAPEEGEVRRAYVNRA